MLRRRKAPSRSMLCPPPGLIRRDAIRLTNQLYAMGDVMDDDPESPGGEMLPRNRALAPATNHRAPAPATDDPNLRKPEDRTDDPQHDDAGGDPDRQHGGNAAARDEPGRKRPARSLQKRIDELVRQRAAAARQRDLWRERALSASADGGAPTQEEPIAEHAQGAEPGGPMVDETSLSPELAAFADRIAEARERHADFDRVAFDPALPVNTAMAEVIARSDHGPEIAYQLGRSPDLARRIAGLDPLSAARELGRLEAVLSPTAARKVTGAPPPIRALDGAESPRRDPDAMSYEQYKRWRSAR